MGTIKLQRRSIVGDITNNCIPPFFKCFKIYVFVALVATLAPCNIYADSSQPSIGEILNYIDSKDYVSSILDSPLDGIYGVWSTATHSLEIRFLIRNCDKTVPEMIARLNQPDGVHEKSTRILYFIVFGECKNVAALPVILEYMFDWSGYAIIWLIAEGRLDPVNSKSPFSPMNSAMALDSQYSVYGYAASAFAEIIFEYIRP